MNDEQQRRVRIVRAALARHEQLEKQRPFADRHKMDEDQERCLDTIRGEMDDMGEIEFARMLVAHEDTLADRGAQVAK